MTKQEIREAIEQLNNSLSNEHLQSDGEWTCYEFSVGVIQNCIEALSELEGLCDSEWHYCPICGLVPYDEHFYCECCGQKLKWGEE